MLHINFKHRIFAVLIILTTSFLPLRAHAAMDMFLNLGSDIPGESVDKVHANQIDILAWSWGASSSTSAIGGGGAGTGKVSMQDFSMTKWVDKASPQLLLSCASGKHIPQAILYIRKAGTIPVDYVVITLTDVAVTSISSGGSGGSDRLTESISLNFTKIEYKYVQQNADGSTADPITVGWNVSANTPL